MLFRSYQFQLKLDHKQKIIFNHLLKYIKITHQYLEPHFQSKEKLTISELREITAPLFEKIQFTPLFKDLIFPQILSNLQKNPHSFENCFPLEFKKFSFDEKSNIISLPFCKFLYLSHSRNLPSKIYKVEILYKKNKWYINFLISKKTPQMASSNLRTIGIDVGLKEFAFLSNGKSINNPRFYEEMKEKISIEQRKLSKKQKDSNGWLKQKNKVNKLYSKIHRQRMDFLHKLTHYLTEKYDVIGVENINIKELQRKKHLRNSLSDASWGEFLELLKYKCEEKGKHLIYVERFYPSTQICSKCGSKRFMPLHIRTYTCKNCGNSIDRDHNASINIENRAKEIYLYTHRTSRV